MTVGGTILQNGLQSRLPQSAKDLVAGIDNIAYAIVPLIKGLSQPEKDVVRSAFAHALVPVWRVLIGVAGVGLLASLPVKGLPLHTTKDESWAMKQVGAEEREGDEESRTSQ